MPCRKLVQTSGHAPTSPVQVDISSADAAMHSSPMAMSGRGSIFPVMRPPTIIAISIPMPRGAWSSPMSSMS